MLESFVLGCNSANVDLRLNSLEVLTVLLGQTEVWLQVQENMFKLIDCFVNIAYECGSNPEFSEPLIQGLLNVFKDHTILARNTINDMSNGKKEALLKLIHTMSPELSKALKQDSRKDNNLNKNNNMNKNSLDNNNENINNAKESNQKNKHLSKQDTFT